ncbi:lipocalin-like domain-containing protein [Costertonia aggregata]|uniref:Lipocalin family protein n=1 Tax=Costertonia aggregata TaxID=343403 RepID=A0A7H9ATZ4_9FLAO|nr:lipocalin family protein [Costertonia aggregata]QLG46961.1 lipocalin family protein [Costertonia aggregata]
MKKFLMLLGATVFFIISCSAPKEARQKRNLISGTWSLDNISYEGTEGLFKSVLFNDAQAICFEGSDWFFRDNNSTGRYTLTAGSLCSGGDRFIRWSVVNNQLQFKFIDEKRKDISGGLGYRLNIADLTAQNMVLKSTVSDNGSPVTVVYNFSKK